MPATLTPRKKSKAASPHALRLTRLRDAMREHAASSILVSNPVDVGYLTGFLGGDSYLLVRLDGSRKPLILTDFRYAEEMREHAGTVDVFIRKKSMTEAAVEVLGSIVGGVAIQADHMTVGERNALAEKLGDRLVPVSGVLLSLRAIKDEHEVGLIESAIRIQERALKAVLPTIKPGQTEMEVAAMLEAAMKTLGASRAGFESIVAAGAKGSLPHYRPGRNKIVKGKGLLIDWGAMAAGYTGDMTRTFALGTWPAKIREIFKVVHEAHVRVAEALAPGKSTKEIDAVARDHISEAGYGEYFGHGLGHGIGMNVHEDPRLSHMLPPKPLVPGMVVTNEPGIYLPGVGGVRIENDYLITKSGCRNLCSLPFDLEWCTL